ncbi:carbohydrate ABC transporter permease [Agromyces archimandritae]|uniref:Sugar ABC transporter permease n=1 Tax=Agromyces archimandritae TaxID=2781962 RepID=A0A975FKV3_9MICO|nr:sugar ABC transporter permease [Agromyces archimandritae]QTX03940.1 sugar ABC transporter permease [Agromyces archimandritae]
MTATSHAAARHPPRRRTILGRENRDGLVMVGPLLVIITLVIIVPIAWTFVLSFQEARYSDIARNGLFNALTLENYLDVLTSPGFWKSLGTTVVYTAGSTIGSIVLGLVAALALRRRFPARGLVRAVMLLPYVAPVVAVAFVWEVLLNPQYGLVNAVGTRILGWEHPVDFLGTAPQALWTVILFETWRYFPFAFMFLAAALTGLPREVEEAAVVDGATPLQRFRLVVLPQLMPTIALLTLLRFVMTFNKFDDVYLLTGGAAGTQVAAVRVYDQLVGSSDIGAASANAVVLAAFLVIALLLYLRFFVRREGNPS